MISYNPFLLSLPKECSSLLSHNLPNISRPPSVFLSVYLSTSATMAVDYRNGVSILLLIFYLPALAIAILLTLRHGFTRSSGWRFIIILSLARILSACFQLATINEPTNTSLYVGYSVLMGIAVSPIELAALGYVPSLQLPIHHHSLESLSRDGSLFCHTEASIFSPTKALVVDERC